MEEVRRVRQRNRRYDETGSAPELLQTPADKFRTGTFLVIIDSINGELLEQLAANASIAVKFEFLRKLKDLPDDQVVKSAEILQIAYPTDLEANLLDELLQFSSFLNTEFVKKSLDVTASPAIPVILIKCHLHLFHTVLYHIFAIVQTVRIIGYISLYKDLNVSWAVTSGSFPIFRLAHEI